jgi:hypothetical protein
MSSRGSWSSLFNSNVRQLIGSGADPARENGHTDPATHDGDSEGIPVPGRRSRKFSGDVDYPRARPALSPQRLSPGIRPDVSTARSPGSGPLMPGQGRPLTFSQVARAKHQTVHKSVIVVDLQHEVQQER